MEKAGVCKRCSLHDRPYVKPSGIMPLADVVIVCGFPMPGESEHGAFTSKNGDILKRMATNLLSRNYSNAERPKVAYTHAIRCEPEYDQQAKKFAYNIDNVQLCSVNLLRELDSYKPKAVVAMGTDAVKAIGFKTTASSMRGGIYELKLNDGTRVPVIVTFHIVEAVRSPGLFPTLEKDLDKAFRIAAGRDFTGALNAVVLKDADDIVAKLNEVAAAADAKFADTGKSLVVSVDTETTSLTPSNPADRVIAVSLAYRDNEGIAYPFQHMANPFTPEDFARVRNATEMVLGHPHVALAMCNGKFDVQWLKYHYGLHMNDCAYDCQLAEHCLDEDKKGQYSLKDITKDRFPAMGKYEQELKEALSKLQGQFNEEWRSKEEAWKQAVQDAMVDWWTSLEADKRGDLLTRWYSEGRVSMSDAHDLREVKKRKVKGELVIPKKYAAAVARLLSRVKPEELPGMELPEKNFPREPREVTFEDVPIDTMLWYAAIDAQTTRMIAAQQMPEFEADNARVNRAQQQLGNSRRIITKPLLSALNEIDMPLSAAIAHMEYNGVRLDRDKCQGYVETVKQKMEEIKDSLFEEVGYKFSLSSSAPDLGKILFEDRRLPVLKRTESGAPSTDADTLRQLYDDYDQVFLKDLLTYRKMDKVLHTYLENWLKMSARDGKIRAGFNQIGTSTFRLSSSSPNLQNVPYALKEANLNLKELFVPDIGYNLLDLDISNAEMRMLTAYSKDKALTDAFNTGKDLHCLTAASISDYTYEDLKAHKEDKTTDQYRKRQLAKKVSN